MMRPDLILLLAALALPPAPATAQDVTGITRTDQLPWDLRPYRKRMIAGSDVPTRGLRGLADAGDSLAAFNFAKEIEAMNDPALLPDALHYYSIAVHHGRDFALPRLLRLLQITRNDLSPGRLANVRLAIERAARRGDARAARALAQMLTRGTPFGSDPVAAREWLKTVAEAGDGAAALDLAMLWMRPAPGLPADPVQARAALELAAASDNLSARTTAENLLRQMDAGWITAPRPPTPDITEDPTQ